MLYRGPYQSQPAPAQLIAADGQPHFGIFDQSVNDLNWPQFQHMSVMDKPSHSRAAHADFRQFQFVAIQSADWLLGVAIAKVRYVNTAFAYLYQRQQSCKVEEWLHPGSIGCALSPSPTLGCSRFGWREHKIQFDLTSDGLRMQLNTQQLHADIHIKRHDQAPIALCNPTGYQGLTYTEKNLALPVSGQLLHKTTQQRFDLTNALGGYDYSAGFMRRETSWRWACLQGYTADGRRLAINLAAGVNETGLTENALWLDGERHLISPAQFSFERSTATATPHSVTWQIKTLAGELELEFHSEFCRSERKNFAVLASNFRQYVGIYQGRLRLASGEWVAIAPQLGLAEDHYAKW
jgi:hypothetical protein